MKEILTADQMRRSDQRMIQKNAGSPSLVLMERAALQCVAAMKAEGIDLIESTGCVMEVATTVVTDSQCKDARRRRISSGCSIGRKL